MFQQRKNVDVRNNKKNYSDEEMLMLETIK